MDIKALQWELAAYVVDRGLDSLHTPRNLSMALAAESGALLALFKWLADDEASLSKPAERAAAADALADSVLHAVHLADRLGIDLDEAIRRKLARNAEKYPARSPAPPVAAATPERRAEPERRVTSERRVQPERRVATERRYEPERRVGPDRRGAETDRRSSPPRARTAPEPAAPARFESPPAVVPTRPTREAPPAARPPTFEETRSPNPPPSRGQRTEAPRARAPEPPQSAPAEPPPVVRHESPPAVRHEPPPAVRHEAPPAARHEPPPPPPEPEPEVDPYASIDVDAARRLVEALSRQVTRARTDDPLARELHDELTTLKRSLYAENPKRAWLAGSLRSIARILEEATTHSVGAELRAREHLADVKRILDF